MQQLYGDSAISEADVVATFSNAKDFTRRVGISYEEIIEILKTRFINPNSTLIPRLERLGVPFSTIKALKDGTTISGDDFSSEDFGKLLPAGLDPVPYGGYPEALADDGSNYAEVMGSIIKAWVTSAYDDIMGLITVSNPADEEDLCSFESLEFRYSDPDKINTPVRAFEFVRLVRFIRLWRKLGWTIEQTDKAIIALYPVDQILDDPDDAVNLQRLDAGFLILLPRLGVFRRVMRALKLKPKKDLLPLLACFAPIDTHGAASLYRQMFLSQAQLKQDPAFDDDGFGTFLTASDQKLLDHAEALRAPFLLTGDERARSLPRSNSLTRRRSPWTTSARSSAAAGGLARKLKLSVREFRLLTQFTGIDPFAPPDPPGPPEGPPILRVIELVSRLRAASLKPEQALYLIWNQDISGKSAPDNGEILEFARTLRAAFAAIESEFALTDDPSGQIARARMALVYGNDATNFHFGLLDNTLVSEVQYDHDQASLEQPILDAALGRIAYDDFGKRLSFTGVMTQAVRDALKVGVPLAFENAVDKLYEENQKVVEPFFDRYPELQPLYELYAFFGELSSRVSYSQADKTLPPAILEAGTGRIAYDHELGRLSFKGVMTVAIHDQLMQVQGITLEFQDAISDLLSANKVAVENFFQDFSQRYPELPIDKEDLFGSQ